MGIEIDENGRPYLRLLSLEEIATKLRDLSFAEAREHLGYFDSYDRTGAMVCVMLRAPTPADRVRIFLDWGNVCDAPWPYRGWIADLLRQACAEVSMPDLLEPADRQFYAALPSIAEVWRGCEKGRERGLHWTTDRATAEGFGQGKRCTNPAPTLVRALIPKQHIFAVFAGRSESEVVLDFRRLRGLEVTRLEPRDYSRAPAE